MKATSHTNVVPGDRANETEVYVPPLVRVSVSASGAAVLDTIVTNPDGSRLAYVAPTGAGAYSVSVG